jgi:hypothetical protein
MVLPQWAVEGGLVLIGFVLGQRYREMHRVDLKSAKDAVEALEAQLPRS